MSKFKSFTKIAAFGGVLGLSVWAAYELTRPPYDGNAGITYGTAYAPIRGSDVDFTIWYPASPGGRAVTVGGNGVFYGTPAGRGAPHQAGRFPVVIISHGAGGNAGQFGWIAAQLAQQGFVVVLPNHPGTTTGNASAEAAVRVWERPADVTAVLDELTDNAKAYPYIDPDHISVLGFSAGGYTALALTGARVDPERLQRFCDDTDHGMSDCSFLAHFDVDLHSFDLSPAGQDLRDPRITDAVIVDPGIVSTLTAESLAKIAIPMQVINLGDEGTIPAGVDAADAASLIPRAHYTRVPDTSHFSFLAQCKPAGARILENEGELDPLCDDAGAQSRAEIHATLVSLIIGYLQRET
ncbi:alpha/beta hydrolase family protein [Loktanella agnita]|uniref:alpha/beta hydrolase family protein n=1 Tax=Loktanella agnita TaxID=287097 RepID=UPI00398A3DDD